MKKTTDMIAGHEAAGFTQPMGGGARSGAKSETRARSKASLRSLGLFILGVAALAGLLFHVGLGEVAALLGSLGWYAPLILLPYAVLTAFDTRGWARTLTGRARETVSFWKLYFIRHAGEAVNHLTPTLGLAGEPVKAYLLRRQGVDAADGVAGVVIAKGALISSQIAFTLLGIFLFLDWLDVLRDQALIMIGGSVTGAAIVVLIVVGQQRGLAAGIARLLRLVASRWSFVQRLERRAADIDEALIRFYREDHGGIFVAFGYHFFAWILGAGEVLLILYLMGIECGWREALIIESLTQATMLSAAVIPGGLGVHELSGTVLARMLGIGEAGGAALMLLKRARDLVFSLGGLALLSYFARQPTADQQKR